MPKTFRVSCQKCVSNSFSCVSLANVRCGRCESFNLNCLRPNTLRYGPIYSLCIQCMKLLRLLLDIYCFKEQGLRLGCLHKPVVDVKLGLSTKPSWLHSENDG